jgi:hypothetical protein
MGQRVQAKNLTSEQWIAKFAAVKRKEDGKTPVYGEISRVAAMEPAVAVQTFHDRWKSATSTATKMGPPPALGPLEDLLYDWLLDYKSLGVCIAVVAVQLKALELADAANIGWEFKATDRWVAAFCKRRGVRLREGQWMETARTRAVTKESLTRFYDIWELVIAGVKPKNIYMLDEVHVNTLDGKGFKVRFISPPTRPNLFRTLY